MDYSKLFEDTYKQKFQEVEIFVNGQFKSSKGNEEDERDFLETYNEVKSQLEEWKTQHFEKSSLKTEIETYRYFTTRNNKATFPEYLFPGVLDQKTKKLFLEKHSEAEYSSFIEDLAENKVYQHVIDIINNYDKYFDLIYRGKKWKRIALTEYDRNYESSPHYLNLHRKIFPPTNHIVSTTKRDFSEEIAQTQQRLKNFTEEEKLFLIKVCYENIVLSRKGLDKTEFMKLCQIISGIEDLSIFYQDAQNSKSYSLLKKKYDYFIKLEAGEFLQILINKLEILGLTGMKAEVKMIQSKT